MTSKIAHSTANASVEMTRGEPAKLAINLKTAKALGLDVPYATYARRRGDRIAVLFAAAR
jgi:hypothetical protein